LFYFLCLLALDPPLKSPPNAAENDNGDVVSTACRIEFSQRISRSRRRFET
jgi:hypothetical protein